MANPETKPDQVAQSQPLGQKSVEQAMSLVTDTAPATVTTPRTEVEIHYKELRSYFEGLVTKTLITLGIVVSVGLILFYKDMSQVRSDANSAIERIRSQAKTEIEQARDSVNRELSAIRAEAASIARDEARKGVDDAFKTTSISTMIEDAAKKEVGSVIEREVRNEANRVMHSIQADISSLGQIADTGMQMRVGLRSGLNQLLELQRTASNENTRMWAKRLFESIATDYDTVTQESLRQFNQNALQALEIYSQGKIKLSNEHNPVPRLLEVIESDRDLRHIAFAFLALREATGVPFRMFDIEGVNHWCDEHKKECRE